MRDTASSFSYSHHSYPSASLRPHPFTPSTFTSAASSFLHFLCYSCFIIYYFNNTPAKPWLSLSLCLFIKSVLQNTSHKWTLVFALFAFSPNHPFQSQKSFELFTSLHFLTPASWCTSIWLSPSWRHQCGSHEGHHQWFPGRLPLLDGFISFLEN